MRSYQVAVKNVGALITVQADAVQIDNGMLIFLVGDVRVAWFNWDVWIYALRQEQ